MSEVDESLFNVARNPETPAEVLTELAKHKDSRIRILVAGNQALPLDVLSKLSRDRSLDVRLRVAGLARTPDDVLAEMRANDRNDSVRLMARRM